MPEIRLVRPMACVKEIIRLGHVEIKRQSLANDIKCYTTDQYVLQLISCTQ